MALKVKILQIFGLRKFSLNLAFNIRGHGENTPYSSSEPNESCIVNRQSGGEKLKYILKFYIGVHVTWYAHAQWRCSIVSMSTWCLGRNISETARDKALETWVQRTTNKKWPIPSPMVTWPMTYVTQEGQGRYPNMLRAQYRENDWTYRLGCNGVPIGNGVWRVEWSGARRCRVCRSSYLELITYHFHFHNRTPYLRSPVSAANNTAVFCLSNSLNCASLSRPTRMPPALLDFPLVSWVYDGFVPPAADDARRRRCMTPTVAQHDNDLHSLE